MIVMHRWTKVAKGAGVAAYERALLLNATHTSRVALGEYYLTN